MKVFYISSRINAPDGSSVHGRAFVRNVKKLGHEIRTFPPLQPIRYIQDETTGKTVRSRWQNLREQGVGRSIKPRIRRLGRLASDLVDLVDGLQETLRYFLASRKIVRDFHPDVLVFRTTLYNFAPMLLRRIYGIPCVAEVNSIKYLEISVASRAGIAARLTRRVEQKTILHGDRVFAVSDSIKTFIDEFYPPQHSRVIANGVETEDFDPSLFDQALLKQETGLKDRIVLGYVGSYKSWHGLPTSLDLIEKLSQQDSRYSLLLIGNGECYQQIKSEVARRGLQGLVKQIDYVPHDQVPRYLAIFDYALMTYPDFEGFYFSPLKMYEYMSMGTPVVSTRTGQISSMIKNGETGVLVYPPTADNFYEAVVNTPIESERYQKMTRASREEAIAMHSWLNNASQVMGLCAELTTDARNGANNKTVQT